MLAASGGALATFQQMHEQPPAAASPLCPSPLTVATSRPSLNFAPCTAWPASSLGRANIKAA